MTLLMIVANGIARMITDWREIMKMASWSSARDTWTTRTPPTSGHTAASTTSPSTSTRWKTFAFNPLAAPPISPSSVSVDAGLMGIGPSTHAGPMEDASPGNGKEMATATAMAAPTSRATFGMQGNQKEKKYPK